MSEKLGKSGQGGASSEELDSFTTEEETTEETQDETTETDETTKETTETTETTEEKADEETTEKDEATETTEETEEETTETEADPKDAVIGDYRRRAREADRRNAELEGLLAAERARVKTDTTETEEKSPVDKYIEEHGEEEPLDGKTMRAQKVFEARQADKATKKAAADESLASNRAGIAYARTNLSEAKKGKGLDFETIISEFGHHLDAGDRLMIEQAGAKGLVEAYNRIITNTLNSGDEDATILKSRIKAHTSKAKPKKKETTKPKTPKGEPIVETDEDLRASTVHIMSDLNMFD